MKTRQLLVAALLVLAVCVLGLAWPFAATVGPGWRPSAPSNAPAVDSVDRGTAAEAEASAATRKVLDYGSVRAMIDYEDGSPADGVRVRLTDAESRRSRVTEITTDVHGHAVFAAMPDGRFRLTIDRAVLDPHSTLVQIIGGKEVEVRVTIPVTISALVRVLDPRGQPVSQAEVWLGVPAVVGRDAQVVGKTDVNGVFRLRAGMNPIVLAARAENYGPSLVQYVHVADHGSTMVDLTLTVDGGTLVGTVLGPSGEPLAGATVRVGNGRLDAIRVGETAPALPAQGFADDMGKFRVVGVPPGRTSVTVRAGDLAPWGGECDVALTKTTDVTCKLVAGACIDGVVRDEAGEAVMGATVSCGEAGSLAYNRAVSGPDGRFRLLGLAGGDQVIRVIHPTAGAGSATIQVRSGERSELIVAISPGIVIRGRVVDEVGDPVPMVRVSAIQHEADKSLLYRAAYTNGDGKFVLTNLLAGPVSVSALHQTIEEITENTNLPMTEELLLRSRIVGPPSSRLNGVIYDGNGKRVANALVRVPLESGRCIEYRSDGNGSFGIPIHSGTRRVIVEAKGWPTFFSDWRWVGQYEDCDFGDIHLRHGGWLKIDTTQARWRDGTHVRVKDSRRNLVCLIKADTFLSPPLTPGLYQVIISGSGTARLVLPTEIREGQETRVQIAPEVGVEQTIEITSALPDTSARIVVCREGATEVDELWLLPRDSLKRRSYFVAPGSHDIEVLANGRVWRERCTVGPEAGPPMQLQLRER